MFAYDPNDVSIRLSHDQLESLIKMLIERATEEIEINKYLTTKNEEAVKSLAEVNEKLKEQNEKLNLFEIEQDKESEDDF